MSVSLPGDAAGARAGAYLAAIHDTRSDPQRLERLYREACEAREARVFTADLLTAYRDAPHNVLYAAWYYRLQGGLDEERPVLLGASWKLAVPLSVGLGLALWLLSRPDLVLPGRIPALIVVWAPITAVFIMGFLALGARRHYVRAGLLAVALAAATAYVLAFEGKNGRASGNTYLALMAAHVPLLAAAAIGGLVLGWRSVARERFAFLFKGVEAIGTAGVFSIAGGIFVGLTYGMFQALSVTIPEPLVRLLVIGGAGLIPVLAVASVYNPSLSPGEQEVRHGFGRILSVLMQALLPLTLLVLAIYVCVIPFNFMQPFINRDVLIVYNAMLFAIMGLLIGVTPTSPDAFPARYQAWLRAGIIALVCLVVLVSLYALAAIVYRTAAGQLTMNRLTVIGWNVANIVILVALLLGQMRLAGKSWVERMHAAFRIGSALYVVWGVFVVLAYPWIF